MGWLTMESMSLQPMNTHTLLLAASAAGVNVFVRVVGWQYTVLHGFYHQKLKLFVGLVL